jgi:hypothetical protein
MYHYCQVLVPIHHDPLVTPSEQAVRKHLYPPQGVGFCKCFQKVLIIFLAQKHFASSGSPVHHMIDGLRELYAQRCDISYETYNK